MTGRSPRTPTRRSSPPRLPPRSGAAPAHSGCPIAGEPPTSCPALSGAGSGRALRRLAIQPAVSLPLPHALKARPHRVLEQRHRPGDDRALRYPHLEGRPTPGGAAGGSRGAVPAACADPQASPSRDGPERLAHRVDAVAARLERILDLYGQGKLDEESLAALNRRLRRRQEAIQQQLATLEAPLQVDFTVNRERLQPSWPTWTSGCAKGTWFAGRRSSGRSTRRSGSAENRGQTLEAQGLRGGEPEALTRFCDGSDRTRQVVRTALHRAGSQQRHAA